jgi:hypothetical protein
LIFFFEKKKVFKIDESRNKFFFLVFKILIKNKYCLLITVFALYNYLWWYKY